MPNYFYIAKSIGNETKTGFMEAKDVKELAQILKSEGLILAKAEIKQDKNKKFGGDFLTSRKVSIKEKVLMTRNLWIMVATGLSLVKGFSILAVQAKSKKMKVALADVSEEVGKGKSLSESFKKYPDIFSELYVSMVQAGEESGTLEESLSILSLQLEKEKEMGSKVKKALIYPVILLLTMLIVGALLIIFVFPKLKTFFAGLGADLPLSTRIILGAGDFFTQYWYFVVLIITLIAMIVLLLLKTKKGKIITDTALIKIPGVSSLITKSNSAAMVRSLSSLMASGVPLIRCLQITTGTVDNFHFKKALQEAVSRVEKGEKLSESFQPNKNIFPYGTIEMIEIGEETGRTSTILKKLAEFYEEEVSTAAESLSVMIEPFLIIIMGICVGIFAISVMGPMYSVLGDI